MRKINIVYPDLENKFPLEIDDFDRFADLDLNSIAMANEYYRLYDTGDIVGAANILKNNQNLKKSILNAEALNKLRDAVISLQRHLSDTVFNYLINMVKSKGDWQASTKYNKYDVVQYVHNQAIQSYMAVVISIPIGTLPTDRNFFIPITLQGAQGVSGTGLSPRGYWSSIITYTADDCVAYNNYLWYAKQESTNKVPEINSDYWGVLFTVPQQIIIKDIIPEGQNPDDIWFKISSDGSFSINQKTIDGQYRELFVKTKAKHVIRENGKTVEETLDIKADLVDGKVPEAQLPVMGGSVVQLDPPENTKLIWIHPNTKIARFYNPSTSQWVIIASTWGA